jgi:hypothetical protein
MVGGPSQLEVGESPQLKSVAKDLQDIRVADLRVCLESESWRRHARRKWTEQVLSLGIR